MKAAPAQADPRAEDVKALHKLNDQAKAMHPSPAWATLHGRINQLIDIIVGL